MPELPLVGDEFAGYRMRAVLGRGGMSVVYQAENLRLGNVIALKVLAPEPAADDLFRARFLEESRIAASLNRPNVIPIYDTGSRDDLLYIAMRYVSGTDWRQMIKNARECVLSGLSTTITTRRSRSVIVLWQECRTRPSSAFHESAEEEKADHGYAIRC
jgi:serine/threonine protein kinase